MGQNVPQSVPICKRLYNHYGENQPTLTRIPGQGNIEANYFSFHIPIYLSSLQWLQKTVATKKKDFLERSRAVLSHLEAIFAFFVVAPQVRPCYCNFFFFLLKRCWKI